jgi:hypothetical protein
MYMEKSRIEVVRGTLDIFRAASMPSIVSIT